jgi:hypothetical protein
MRRAEGHEEERKGLVGGQQDEEEELRLHEQVSIVGMADQLSNDVKIKHS